MTRANEYVSSRTLGRHVHAKLRAKERHGLALSDADIYSIVALIKAGDRRVVLLRASGKVAACDLVAVRWGRAWLPIYYDRGRGQALTVLPGRHLDPYREPLEWLAGELEGGTP